MVSEAGAAIGVAILTPRPAPYTRESLRRMPAACTRDLATMPSQSFVRVEKKSLRLDDEMQFIRSWIEKPLSTGAVMPSSKALARTMARYVDPQFERPGDRTRARHRSGDRGAGPARRRSRRVWSWSNSILTSAACCARAIRRRRSCRATPIGCARLLETYVREPAAAVVSGLPLVTKPLRTRLRLISDAMASAGDRARRSSNSPTRWCRRSRRRCPASRPKPPN